MAPPLAYPVSRVVVHGEFPLPATAAELVVLRDCAKELCDTAFARGCKTVHCPRNCSGTVHEHRKTDGAGPLRIYFSMAHGCVVLLHWGRKQHQDADIAVACTRGDWVAKASPAQLAKLASLA